MVVIAQNIADAQAILSNPNNICCINWWSRDDIENHLDRPLTDEEWSDVSNRLEDYGIDTEQLVICLDEVGIK
jgi:hypothetical protein